MSFLTENDDCGVFQLKQFVLQLCTVIVGFAPSLAQGIRCSDCRLLILESQDNVSRKAHLRAFTLARRNLSVSLQHFESSNSCTSKLYKVPNTVISDLILVIVFFDVLNVVPDHQRHVRKEIFVDVYLYQEEKLQYC
jgi:hypothetical protein